MGFPPFSGDGRYLEVLYVREMERVLGSPDDDSTNAFTARMLLLLESQPVYDAELYASLLERIVGFYYRDFADHAEDFVPGFLVNDILRFWRTLTLNYEHHRRQLQDLAGEELRRKKASSALKNYKLKVSRMATCYSMIANLSSEPRPVTADTVLELCRMTPGERLARLSDRGDGAKEIVVRLEHAYEEFLQDVQRPEDTLLDEFASEDVRSEKLERAAGYGKLIYELLVAVVPDDADALPRRVTRPLARNLEQRWDRLGPPCHRAAPTSGSRGTRKALLIRVLSSAPETIRTSDLGFVVDAWGVGVALQSDY